MKNMKKLLTIATIALIFNPAFAQSDAASKSVRFGLKVTPALNWYKSGDKMTEKNGISPKFGAGLMLEFRLTNTAVFATGLQLDLDGGKVKYKNDLSGNASTTYITYYYNKPDDEIAEYVEAQQEISTTPSSATKYDAYLLNERKYSNTYITLPLCLKLKTKEIGSFTYFGMIGANASILYSSKATDEVQKFNTTTLSWNSTNETISKTKIYRDMSFFNAALNMGAGAEWNLSGSTSLTFGINYLLGFLNVADPKSDFLRKQIVGTADGEKLKQNLKSNSIGLTIGVLF
jgi:hypothetical protein